MVFQYAELGRSGKQGEIYWTKLSPANNHVMIHPPQSVSHVTVKPTPHIKPNKVILLLILLIVLLY